MPERRSNSQSTGAAGMGSPHAGFAAVAERQQALWRRYPTWQPRTLDQMFDDLVAQYPDRPYVITDQRSWTYREIQVWSERIAAGLVAAGVQPGDHVGLLLANYPEFVAVKFGIAALNWPLRAASHSVSNCESDFE